MTSEASVADLATVLARIQGMLLSEANATAAVHQLAQVAEDLVPAAVGAGVSLVDESRRRTSAGATGSAVESADDLQYELGEGPCLSAWATGTVQRVDDTALDDRWPRWSEAVQRGGIRSALSVPLPFRGRSLGALKVYATVPGAFAEHEEQVLGLLAGAAATLLGSAQARDAPHRISDSLHRALRERQTIALATGMLMEQRGTDEEDAHAVLLTASRNQRRPLVEVARRVLERHPDSED